ncbi:siderophore-interacting protein [Xanthobacter versatilis]|uniref:siderophore-interacting protein n=1 Tax=Xanthobacter autotrophicus (strain ATCC BAA-1158 / Py2) TaxID=78245 RepID=UPI00372BD3F0
MNEVQQVIRKSNRDEDERQPRRVRHELRFRLLQVRQVEKLTPHMTRITLGGDELEGFTSPGFDDHVKLFFPAPGEDAPSRPELGEKSVTFPDGRAHPIMRDFTPRHYDPVARTLQIDFALHDGGPASDWARQARPGQMLGVGGPRGSFILPTDFDWHLLIGDEAALPAIARRLDELPVGARAVVLVEVEGEADELPFETNAVATIHWVHRGKALPNATPLVEALKTIPFPGGEYHAWIAGESETAKQLRQALIAEHGANPKWVRASGYWRRGATAVHDSLDE